MDPISAIGDERRRMVENTQRSSSSLHAQTVKRHKDRIKRGNVNSSYHTEDPDDAYDGDFSAGEDEEDLDYSGGGGNAELFRQMWEDDVEANLPEPMAGDTIFEEVQSSGLLGDDEGCQAPLSEWGGENVSPEGECEEISEWHENETLVSLDDVSSAALIVKESQEGSAEQDVSNGEDVSGDVSGDISGDISGEVSGDISGESSGEVSAEPAALAANREPPDVSGTGAVSKSAGGVEPAESVAPDPSEPSPEQISMGDAMADLFGGLDSLFSFGDTAVPLDGKADIMQIISTPLVSESLPRAALPPVSADIGEILDKLIIGNVRSTQIERLRSFLGRFGKGVLSCCLNRGIKVHLVPAGQLSGVDILRGTEGSADVCGGVFNADNRTCYIDEQTLSSVPQGSNPVIFFMAQAWDHALGEDDFASLHSPAVIANFEACRNALCGHRFGDALSAISPVFYFAQAVEAYLAENDCSSELWNREDLYDFDRSMYDYVEYLFKQGNR